ncbi:MAG: DUF2254 domain-containing protein [Acidimicrobiia bacterium]
MLFSWFDRIKDSFFLIPAGIIVFLGALSRIAVALDGLARDEDSVFPWLVPTTVDSARAILSTVATATVTVAAIVFSMTAVVVQLATSQFSPRVTQGFLRDRYQQVTIGLTIGTFVYALLVLAAVRGGEENTGTTHDVSVTIAVVLAVASMIAIVSFIDRIMRKMRIDTIVRGLAEETKTAFEWLPEREVVATDSEPSPDGDSVSRMAVTKSGWVRSIDVDALLDGIPDGTTVRLDIRPGDYIAAGEVAATMWPAVDEQAEPIVGRAIDLGRTRTIETDPSYGIRQLVDIALRALSTSLNDATTGADVVHHLTGPISAVLLRDLPGRVAGNDRGSRVFMPRALTHSDYVHGAFREIRINSADQPHVLMALLDSLSSLIGLVEEAELESRTTALRQEAQATIEVIDGSSFPERDKEHLHQFARSVGLEER